MIIDDLDAISKVLNALVNVRRAETLTKDGKKVTGYYVIDKQIRIDIVEGKASER